MEIVFMLRLLLIRSFLIIQFISLSVSADSVVSDLDDLIVTGTLTPITIDEIGSSYTVITEEQIEQRQAVLVSDLLRDVPGFAVSRSGVVGSQTQVRVRGAEANQLLVLIDGVEANDIAGSGEFNFAHLLTTNIARIEIIRGPQSALYGSDALAGVINIITKKGSGPTTLSGYVEAGSFGTFHDGGGISGSGERYHYNLYGSYLSSSGTNIAPSGDEDDGYDNGTISFSAGVTPFDNLKFDFTGRHTEASNEFDAQGRAVRQFNGEGELVVELIYNPDGTTTVVDALGNSRLHTYDNRNTLVGETDALGATLEKTYDGNYRPMILTDPGGSTSYLDWDGSGANLTSIVDADGQVTQLSYDDRNNLTQVEDALARFHLDGPGGSAIADPAECEVEGAGPYPSQSEQAGGVAPGPEPEGWDRNEDTVHIGTIDGRGHPTDNRNPALLSACVRRCRR